MIRHPVTEEELERMIDEAAPGWRRRARARTRRFEAAGRYNEEAGAWSEVKGVYMKIQRCKCAYCERKLEGEDVGKIEHDVEHFRPKNGVRKWPAAGSPHSYRFSTGDDFDEGYYLLAYHPLNYAVACKPCNTPLKSNYFPIAGRRGSRKGHPNELVDEKCYLIYPIGSIDVAPEELMTFDGIIPVPRFKSGHRSRRVRVIIDLFQLHLRENLLEQRAERIMGLYTAMKLLEQAGVPDDLKDFTRDSIEILLSSGRPHCNCLRAYHELYGNDPARAEMIAGEARNYLKSRS
jgi:hypothetical protein